MRQPLPSSGRRRRTYTAASARAFLRSFAQVSKIWANKTLCLWNIPPELSILFI